MVLVSNKDATAKQKDEANRECEAADSDFEPDDIMNDSAKNLFIPPYMYQRKDVFKFFYHIGLIFILDIGFQQASL